MNVLPALPDNRELARELPSSFLYALERAGEISRAILDERVTDWAAGGWTQQQIAAEIGCTRQAIAKRMTRLGVTPAHPEKRKHTRMSNRVAHPDAPAETWDFSEDAEGVCPTCHGTGRIPIHQEVRT